MNLLDLLFPKRCVSCGKFGSYICSACFLKIDFVQYPVCPVCERQAVGGKTHPGCKKRFGLDGLAVACKYRGTVRKAVQKIKYRFVFDIHKILVDLIADSIWRYSLPKNIVLVPIPLYRLRKNWRGFNQAELLAQDLAKRFGENYLCDLLVRTVDTKTQVGLSREDRKRNVKSAFGASRKLNGENIILVDDVFTTGSTMMEAAKVLKMAGAGEVWAMAVVLD